MESKQLSDILIKTLIDKKAKDVIRIFVSEKTVIADYFVIADAPNPTLVKALAEYCEDEAEKNGVKALRKEGISEGRWVVVDFGGVILHIFNKESREFYRIERLWQDENNVESFTDEE